MILLFMLSDLAHRFFISYFFLIFFSTVAQLSLLFLGVGHHGQPQNHRGFQRPGLVIEINTCSGHSRSGARGGCYVPTRTKVSFNCTV